MSRKHFYQFLGDVRAGELNDELTTKLALLVAAVQNTGKTGSLKLTIKITPTKSLAVEIDDEVDLKLPHLAKPSTILFPTVEGNLVVNNPMQRQLPLQVLQDGGTLSLHQLPPAETAGLVEIHGFQNSPALKSTGTEGQ